ncbi:hypothetical protein M422DRAFT_258611 [Sphaerobolus stellatus SS14]|uniref:Uncharacterized protein n=1 Tax=Sphaerobolus stellatus (strain SS14) TaxID=990650 RepID=A0A0C9UV62_SPHS4|nr:hypothetical protein M422DRAFT_258611 [Sphaerobolus stellatus SS14]
MESPAYGKATDQAERKVAMSCGEIGECLRTTPLLSQSPNHDVYDRFSPVRKRIIVAVIVLAGIIAPSASGSFVPCIPEVAKDLNTTGTVIKQLDCIYSKRRGGGEFYPEDRLSVLIFGLTAQFVDGKAELITILLCLLENSVGVDIVLLPAGTYIVDILLDPTVEVMIASRTPLIIGPCPQKISITERPECTDEDFILLQPAGEAIIQSLKSIFERGLSCDETGDAVLQMIPFSLSEPDHEGKVSLQRWIWAGNFAVGPNMIVIFPPRGRDMYVVEW